MSSTSWPCGAGDAADVAQALAAEHHELAHDERQVAGAPRHRRHRRRRTSMLSSGGVADVAGAQRGLVHRPPGANAQPARGVVEQRLDGRAQHVAIGPRVRVAERDELVGARAAAPTTMACSLPVMPRGGGAGDDDLARGRGRRAPRARRSPCARSGSRSRRRRRRRRWSRPRRGSRCRARRRSSPRRPRRAPRTGRMTEIDGKCDSLSRSRRAVGDAARLRAVIEQRSRRSAARSSQRPAM